MRPQPGAVSSAPAPHPATSGPIRATFRDWTEDLRFAWRSLRREPRFSATAVLVLGVGIALNAAVLAVVNAYLLRPLPYPEPERVVSLRAPVGISSGDVEGVLEKRVTWDLDAFTLVGDQGPEMARGAWITPDFLEVYGIRPALGRAFSAEDAVPGAPPVALISYGLWQSRYGGAQDVMGRSLQAYTSDRPNDAESFTIIGVLPPDFWHFNDYTQILAALREDRNIYAGRLVPGMPPSRAGALITERARMRLAEVPPEFSVEVVRTQDQHVAQIRPTLVALQSAVLLVFLIACANVAVLLLVRSTQREREVGSAPGLGSRPGTVGSTTRVRRSALLNGRGGFRRGAWLDGTRRGAWDLTPLLLAGYPGRRGRPSPRRDRAPRDTRPLCGDGSVVRADPSHFGQRAELVGVPRSHGQGKHRDRRS